MFMILSSFSFRTTTASWCTAAQWITPSWSVSSRSSTASPSGSSSWCSASRRLRREQPSSPTSSGWHRSVGSRTSNTVYRPSLKTAVFVGVQVFKMRVEAIKEKKVWKVHSENKARHETKESYSACTRTYTHKMQSRDVCIHSQVRAQTGEGDFNLKRL